MIYLSMLLTFLTGADVAPGFSAKNLKGEEVYLDSLVKERKLVIIDFWGVLCKPCLRQLEVADELYEEMGEDLLYIALNEDDPMFQPRVRNFIRSRGYGFTVLLDNDGEIKREYGVEVLPTTFFIGDSLKILEVHEGFDISEVQWFKDKVSELIEKDNEGAEE